MHSGITSGRVLNGELLYTEILEVNLFAFVYRLFRRDFSPLDGTYCMGLFAFAYRLFRRDFSPLDGTYCMGCKKAWAAKRLQKGMSTHAICPVEWGEISTKQSLGKCKQINF